MFLNGRNRTVMLVVATALVVAVLSTAPNAGAGPTCFGRTPTIRAIPGVPTVGTSGPDVILGTSGPDIIYGKGGGDYICSRGGVDTVYGNGGADHIDLGKGSDIASGGKGDDVIEGGSGPDLIRGQKGADEIRAQKGKDVCYGGAGPDALYSCNHTAGDAAAVEIEMAQLVNQLRARVGAGSLDVSVQLSDVARDWSGRLRSSFRHNPGVGSQIPSGWSVWGENIAYNSSMHDAFDALVDSPGHYSNMVNPEFTDVGIGIVEQGSNVYVTQVFASY